MIMETHSGTDNRTARDSIIASIRRGLATSAPFDAEHQKHHRPAVSQEMKSGAAPSPSGLDLIEGFKASLELVGGKFCLVSDLNEAAREIRSVIDNIGAKDIAVSDSTLVASAISGIRNRQFRVNVPSAELFNCDLGITSAQWAIAETGTLVLESDMESHRLTSLIPPVHLCLIEANSIRQTLGEILDLIRRDLSRAVTFITGASRTSDIELTLAIGVHGPGELHVIVVNA